MNKAVVAAIAVAVLGMTTSPATADYHAFQQKESGRVEGISACARMLYDQDGAECTAPTYCQRRKHGHRHHEGRKHQRRHCLPASVRSEP